MNTVYTYHTEPGYKVLGHLLPNRLIQVIEEEDGEIYPIAAVREQSVTQVVLNTIRQHRGGN